MEKTKCTAHSVGRLTLLLCLALAALSCRTSIVAGEIEEASRFAVDETGKIPARAFFSNGLFRHVRISPSGRRIAAVLSRESLDVLVSIELRTMEPTQLAFLERKPGAKAGLGRTIRDIGWASEDVVAASTVTPASRSGMRIPTTTLVVSNVNKPNPKTLGDKWPNSEVLQIQDRVISWMPDHPGRLLMNVWGRARQVDLKSGQLRRVEVRKTQIGGWQADYNDDVRIGHSSRDFDNRHEVWGRVSVDDRVEKLVQWDPYSKDEEGMGFYFIGFSPRPEMIYVLSERQTGRFALYEFNMRTKELGRKVFGHDQYDVARIRTSDLDGRLLSVHYIDDRMRAHFVDKDDRRILAPILREFSDQQIDIVSTDRNEHASIFVASSADSPPTYYHLNHETGEYGRLFDAWPGLTGQTFASTDRVQFGARDGLQINGYVTRPPGLAAPNATIVLTQSSPFSRNSTAWDSIVQFLASRGFTVVRFDCRGSTGYGRAFREAGYQEYGRGMQNDIEDGVKWLISEGLADPGRIGIFGSGYGGYTALQGLVATPDLFAAGASFGGISDLLQLLYDDKVYYSREPTNRALIGSSWTDRDYLRSVSPAEHADKIKASVLLGHGTDDWHFHIRQTDRMTDSLEAAGADYEVYRYRGENHRFIDERSRIDFYQRLGAFFEKHLKPDPDLVQRPITQTARNTSINTN